MAPTAATAERIAHSSGTWARSLVLNLGALAPFLVVRVIWVALVVALTIAMPLALATSVPGLVFAAWISPLKLAHTSTYVGACVLISALTVGLRQSRPLRFYRRFMSSPPGQRTAMASRGVVGTEGTTRSAALELRDRVGRRGF